MMKSRRLARPAAPILAEAAELLRQEKNMNNVRQTQMRERDFFQDNLVLHTPTATWTQMIQL